MIVNGLLLRHMGGNSLVPVDLNRLDFIESWPDGRPYLYPVRVDFDERRRVGWASVKRLADGHLWAQCYIDRAEGRTHLAPALVLRELDNVEAGSAEATPSSDGFHAYISRARLVEVGLIEAEDADRGIPPFEIVVDEPPASVHARTGGVVRGGVWTDRR
jgi:hypothetical protein